MQRVWRWGPRQKLAVEKALGVVDALGAAQGAAAVRGAAAEQALLGVDISVERGGGGGSLLEALAVAEALGQRLPRSVGAALWEAAPVRVLSTLEKGRAMLPQVLKGQTAVALLDVTSAPVKLERRPGLGNRLTGDVPPTVVPLDARWLLVVFEDRPDWYGVALLSANHAPLRVEPLDGLPLGLMSGVLDVEVSEEDSALDASLEVLKALACEELIRAARGVGEAHAALGQALPVSAAGWDTLTVARTALHAAAERMLDVGPYTLLGEEARYGPAGASLEARGLSRQAGADAVGVLHQADCAAHPATLQPGLHAALDVAQSAPYDVARGVWFKLGDARQGALFASRTRPPVAGRGDSRTPLPADAEGTRTQPPAGRSAVPGRATTSRTQGVHVEWGPLPFVPDDVRRVQMETRQLVLEQLEPQSQVLDRDGTLSPTAWDAVVSRGLLAYAVPTSLGGAGLGLRALTCALEEMGRTHPLWGHGVAHNGLTAWAVANAFPKGVQEAQLAPLMDAKAWANVLHTDGWADAQGALTGVALGDGRPDAALWLVNTPRGPGLFVAGQEGMAAVTAWDRGERDLPAPLDMPLTRAVPLAWTADAFAPRMWQAEQLTAAARLCGITAHVLELWRASLQGRPDATRVTQVQQLGQGWIALAQVRAVLWTAVMRVDAGEDAASECGAACRAARVMCLGTLERALQGAGVEVLRSRGRLRDHLKTARRLGAQLTSP